MKRILVVCTTGMGDALWGTPAIKALKQARPEAEIDIMVQPSWKALFEDNPNIHKIFSYEPLWTKQLLLAFKLLLRKYDCSLLFHVNKDFRRMIPLIRCNNIWAHQKFSWIAPDKTLIFEGRVHGIRRRLEVIKKIGFPSDSSAMEIFLTDRDRKTAQEFLKEKGIGDIPFVYVNMGASLAHKRWPSERFSEVTRRILETGNNAVVLGGGPEEADIIDDVCSKFSERVISVYDRPIRANSALIEKARLMITTDTGPMHIGLALKTPMVALFGPTHPDESGPYQIDASLCKVIQSIKDGIPLCETRPPDMNYFEPISVEDVWEQASALLS